MNTKRKWDIGDEEVVVVEKSHPLPIRRSSIASTAVKVIFGVLTVVQSVAPSGGIVEFNSNSDALVQVVRVARQDLRLRNACDRWKGGPADTTVGMSVKRLSELYPKLFNPDVDESVDTEAFFLS